MKKSSFIGKIAVCLALLSSSCSSLLKANAAAVAHHKLQGNAMAYIQAEPGALQETTVMKAKELPLAYALTELRDSSLMTAAIMTATGVGFCIAGRVAPSLSGICFGSAATAAVIASLAQAKWYYKPTIHKAHSADSEQQEAPEHPLLSIRRAAACATAITAAIGFATR